jgi:hypothetical protein
MPRNEKPDSRRVPRDKSTGTRRERLSARETFRLIMSTYRTSLPFLLIFIAGLVLATWLLTELVF